MAYPDLTIDDNASRVSCIHYANSLHWKLGDEMEGRFNEELPDNLQATFQKAVNFEPSILTKQQINTRKVNEVNHIDVSNCDDYQEIEAHIRNPNYKGKNYDPNYQKNSITIILTAPAIHLVLDTRLTITTTMEGTSTTTRATSQKSQQMFKSPSLGLLTRNRCTKYMKF